MRVFALSDLHADYPENLAWLRGLGAGVSADQSSEHEAGDYCADLLILAGDVSDDLQVLEQVLRLLSERFAQVLFVPGNHDLWVRSGDHDCSLEKYQAVNALCHKLGVITDVYQTGSLSLVPLLGWYDFTFGEPDKYLRRAWRDFRACRWPADLDSAAAVTDYFLKLNQPRLTARNDTVISFSHFLPSLAVMPAQIPVHRRRVYPVLGSDRLGEQVRALQPDLHIYGHSHVNQVINLEGTTFVNNAFAYPDEQRISRKRLLCVWDSDTGLQC
ncbi:MAG: metallophosphoesterase [Pseudohongiellaceae bacterium]